MKKIHEKTREAIEKKGKNIAAARNTSRKELLFQPGYGLGAFEEG